MSIQQDILDTIGPDGIEVIALKDAVGALERARRLRINGDRYEIVPSKRPLGSMPSLAAVVEKHCKEKALETSTVSFHSAQRVSAGNHAPTCAAHDGKRCNCGIGTFTPPNTVESRPRQSPRASVPKIGAPSGPAALGRDPIKQSAGSAGERAKPNSAETTSQALARQSGSSGGGSPEECQTAVSRDRKERQDALNRIAMLEVDLANERSKFARCEQFLEMWESFSVGVA